MKRILLSLFLLSNAFIFAQATCATAIDITANGTFVTGAIDGTYPTGAVCYTSQSATPNAKWYKFTPTADGVVTISSNIAPNAPNLDTRLSILTGVCGGPYTCVIANDDLSEAGNIYNSVISNLSVNNGETYYILWDDRWSSASFSFSFAFTAQTCFKPTAFVFTTQPTTSTASIGWTAPASGTPTGYQFEYGIQGFTQGSGTILTTTTPIVSLSGLSAATVYDFYVRTKCGATDNSVWTAKTTFTTVFPPATVPYNTSFENTQHNFIGWLAGPGTTNPTDWFINEGPTLSQEGNSASVSLSSATAVATGRLSSRAITLAANQLATVTYFVRNFIAGGSTGTGNYVLSVGTSPVASSQTTVLATVTGIADVTYIQKTSTFTPTVSGNYYFSFLHNSPANATGAHGLFMDNFTITQLLSTSEFISNKFSISPNPTNSLLNINSLENIGVSAVSITDLNGRVIKNVAFNGVSDIQLNVSDLSSGMYMLNIKSEQGTATKKFIKN